MNNLTATQSTSTAATEANANTTAINITGHSFTLPAGKSARFTGIAIFQTAATTTGMLYGVKVTTLTGANANLIGSWNGRVGISGSSVATGLDKGGNFNVAANTTVAGAILGTAVSAISTNHDARIDGILTNLSTNTSATIQMVFASEVAASAVTLQIGSGLYYEIL